VIDWYQQNIADTGRSAALFALIGFLVTYGLTRWITLRIRGRSSSSSESDAGAVKDVYIGGVHIHHQVWGILLVLVVGLLELRFRPDAPWVEILAVLFGVGAALALDEFALWLHVEDVYWTEEGRKSIDAVMVAVVVGLALLAGTSPIGVDASTVESDGWVVAAVLIAVHIGYTVICLLKGKIATGLIGLPVPTLSFIGSIRLAKPTSYWAQRYYSETKMARSLARFDEEHQDRIERLRDFVSGGSGRAKD
jgi:hypothetical protein